MIRVGWAPPVPAGRIENLRAAHGRLPFSRQRLLDDPWGDDDSPSDRGLDLDLP
jgi:hypothetical protein